jgi:hypothetical protein
MDYCVYVCANLCFGILGICACFKIETMFSRLHIRRESQNRVYIFFKKNNNNNNVGQADVPIRDIFLVMRSCSHLIHFFLFYEYNIIYV